MNVVTLAGGVGGAKLLVGLDRALRARGQPDLTAIVNTGDDTEIYGVHVSPDVDICTYWLAGVADTERGWGIKGDAFTVLGALRSLGADAWFELGDRDFATCLYRTQRLAAGEALSTVTDNVRRALGVRARIVPMTNDLVRTMIATTEGRTLEFQEYFVKHRTEPEVAEILFTGMADARPTPGVLNRIAGADRVILCPSNPAVSIGPILGLRGVRDALRRHPDVVGVTPIVRGSALKGPADRMMTSLGGRASASGVARLYADFIDTFVVDASDAAEAPKVEAFNVRPLVLDTIMSDHRASERLAHELLRL
jgi:LPPG:FO 2-phospho-L-lactate transferase